MLPDNCGNLLSQVLLLPWLPIPRCLLVPFLVRRPLRPAVVEGAKERPAAVAHIVGVPYLHAAEGLSPRGRGQASPRIPRAGSRGGRQRSGLRWPLVDRHLCWDVR